VAKKRRPQTAQRMFDFDGALVVKPESARLAVLIDISCNSSLNVGLTYAPIILARLMRGKGCRG
jgi:hypothetical protein